MSAEQTIVVRSAPQTARRPTRTEAPDPDRAAVRRLQELSSVLSAMARETAEARRDVRRLLEENAGLRDRVSRLTREARNQRSPGIEQ